MRLTSKLFFISLITLPFSIIPLSYSNFSLTEIIVASDENTEYLDDLTSIIIKPHSVNTTEKI